MDSYAVLRTGATNLTQDETLTAIRIGPMNRPMWLKVLVPSITGTGDTLDVEGEICDASASTTQVQNFNMEQIDAAGLYQMPIFTLYEYLQVKLNVTDNDTGAACSFGAVKVWLDPAPSHADGKQS